MDFQNKNVLVVGGSSGIGLSLVQLLIDEQCQIYNVSRNGFENWNKQVRHLSLDMLSDLSPLAPFLPETLHGLVYCAGSINLKPFNRLTEQDFLNDYRINVLSAALVTQIALKSLKAAAGASVVYISSVAARTGLGFHASIASAKSALEGLAVSLAAELASQQIRVNVVAPSLTDTALAQNLLNTPEKREASAKRHPLGKYGQAKDVSAAIRFLLSSESSWITGQVLGIDGGMGNLRNF